MTPASPTSASPPPGPLAGVRVLDLSRVLSGPHCGRALADLGADVVKVEPPQGDLTRFFRPRSASISRYFAQQNAGKRNLSLDLRRPAAAALLLRLMPAVDVLVENFRPGVLDRMGLGYQAASRANPRLVYASITGWGQDGPASDRRAYAAIVQAEAGTTARSIAMHGGEPRGEAFSHADVYAGLHALSGILAALYQRERTGTGQHVDIAMAASLLAVNEHVQSELDPGWERRPGSDPGEAPIFRMADGRLVAVSAHPCGPGNFDLYVEAMGRPELAADPRFADAEARFEHHDELLAEIQAWVGDIGSFDDLAAALATVRIPVGLVRTVAEAAALDWCAHRGAITEVSDRAGGTIRIPQAPWRFSGAVAAVAGEPAFRGEHNREVLGELGVDDDELDRLEAEGVLSSRLPARPGPPPPAPG